MNTYHIEVKLCTGTDWCTALKPIEITAEHKEDVYKKILDGFEALEKQTPKKPVCKEMPYSEEVGFNDEYYCPVCNSYVGYFTEGMSEPEQMEYCNECGQHIARDWSENHD